MKNWLIKNRTTPLFLLLVCVVIFKSVSLSLWLISMDIDIAVYIGIFQFPAVLMLIIKIYKLKKQDEKV